MIIFFLLSLHLSAFNLSIQKSRGGCEQTFILISHYVANVGRKARFDTGVLEQLELLSP